MKRLLVIAGAVAVAAAPVGAALKPIAVASNSGKGATVMVSGGPADRWRVVVTTRPSGVRVAVRVPGASKRVVGRGPMTIDYACGQCRVSYTAQLLAAGQVSIALYRR